MTGHYKEAPDTYAYQRELESHGFERMCGMSFGCGAGESNLNPSVFYKRYQPEGSDPREWRKAIQEYINKEVPELRCKTFKIVRAVGYWRDLWEFVYEVWVKK